MEEKTTAKVTFDNLPKSLEDLIELVKEIQETVGELKATALNQQPKEYYTREEVADLLKIDLSTLHNWVKKEKLPSLALGVACTSIVLKLKMQLNKSQKFNN